MTVGILGLGLIGGSLARAYKLAGHTVYVKNRDERMLSFAMLSGAVDGKLNEDTIPQCDLILLAIYPAGSADWLEANAPLISKRALVIDCCGTKQLVCQRCFPIAKEYGFTFVGGHPMAGSQFSGFKYSRASLFQGAPMVLVPPVYDDMALLQRVKDALEPCGFGFFSVTTAADHDRMIAFTSQMPHILSNAFIKSPTALEHKGFSAGSYRDLTRVAWLNPGMWTELFLENRENLLFELDTYIQSLTQYRDALANQDEDTLYRLLDDGKKRKEEVDGCKK
jgi:prephenate dehydrogenase